MTLFVESGVIFVPFSKCTTKKKGYEKMLISMLMIYRQLKLNDSVLFNEIRMWKCLFLKVIYITFWYELRTQGTKHFNKEVLLCATD